MEGNILDEQQGGKIAKRRGPKLTTESNIEAFSCPFREQSESRHRLISAITSQFRIQPSKSI
jgi:hypothetical protein